MSDDRTGAQWFADVAAKGAEEARLRIIALRERQAKEAAEELHKARMDAFGLGVWEDEE